MIIVGSILLSAWVSNRWIEGAFFVVEHICIRREFEKQFHFSNTGYCLALTLTIIWLCIPITLPTSVSLLSSIPVAFIVCYLGWIAQDRIDTKNMFPVKQFDIRHLTKEQVLYICNELGYKKDKQDLAIMFFVDKLSMLYNALHSSAQNVCFLLRRGYCNNNKSAVEIFIGTTDARGDNGYNISGDVLQRGLNGLFPGVSSEVSQDIIQELKESLKSDIAISCVSGVASLREDDKKEHFVQGLEKLIDSTSGLKFSVCFIAERVDDSECSSILANYQNLHSALAPMAERQLSFSQNETRGINETSSKTFTETVGASLSKTITK